jgi:hypothetical protein
MRILGVTASSYELYTAFESIATATGTGSSGTITFSSIPSTYQHLQLRWTSRVATTFSTIRIRFNSDTGSNYAYHDLVGGGASASASGSASQTFGYLGGSPGTSYSSNITSVGIVDIHDYASTTKNKTIRNFSGFDTNGDGSIYLTSSLWMNTNAINTITLTNAANSNWTTLTTFALYGIKGA